jgi:hypothetical protein
MVNEPYVSSSTEQLQVIQSNLVMGSGYNPVETFENDISGVSVSQTFVNKSIVIGAIGVIGFFNASTSTVQLGCITGLYEEYGEYTIYENSSYLEENHNPTPLFDTHMIDEDITIVIERFKYIINYNETADEDWYMPILECTINGESVELNYTPILLFNDILTML